MKHKLWFDEENDILMFQIIGDYATEEARGSEALMRNAFENRPFQQLIVDLSQAGPMESRETRKIQNESMRKAGVTHTAFVGAGAAIRMIARVMIKLGSENLPSQFFATTEEAISWLKGQRRPK